MDANTQADFAYLDTFTTVFTLYITYLVTIRVLENWLYWIVINAISIYLSFNKDLMLAYSVLATWGYHILSKQHPLQKAVK